MADNVVGRTGMGTTPAATANPLFFPSTVAAPAANTAALAAAIAAKLGAKNINVPVTTAITSLSTVEDYTPEELTKIGLALRKLKYPVKNTSSSVKALLLSEPDLVQLSARSNTATDLINSLSSIYLPGLDSSSGGPKAPALPTQQIQQIDPAIKNAIVRSVFQTKLGRDETPEELKASLVDVEKMINKGQVTTTKVVNGKNQTTYTPGYSQARAEASIASGIDAATEGPIAQDLKEKKSLDFMDFLSQMRG